MDTRIGILPFDKKNDTEKNYQYEELGGQILAICGSEICVRFPFLCAAVSALSVENTKNLKTIGTDGSVIKVNPLFLIKTYESQPQKLKKGYLHMLFHCLYLHPFFSPKEDEKCWNLACDLAVELLIYENISDDLWKLSGETDRKKKEYLNFFKGKTVTANGIYHMLKQGQVPFEKKELEELFTFDDHSLWKIQKTKNQADRRRWERLLTYTTQGKERQKHRIGTAPGNREEELERLYKSRYDYRKFLKKFAFPREELQLDEESFDYIFYHYGMEHYGNLPLIEPLEYKEVNRLEELVIAIDTSGSCSRELVQLFLGETYNILSTKENFFKKMKVYIVQCDCCIQDVSVIHCEAEWKAYIKNVKIHGRSGTDFRPVFGFIKKEQEKRELQHLKALIYFTDGDGIYPGRKPEYETAFVFVKKTENMRLVPAWAYKLVIS